LFFPYNNNFSDTSYLFTYSIEWVNLPPILLGLIMEAVSSVF